jgi:NCS1 family nucleobase:cation symporter-1
MIGGYAAELVGAIDGLICLITGSLVGTFLATMPLAIACQRYGLEQIDYSKTAFGQRGSKIILVFYLINMIGWTGLILVMFGNGIRNVLRGLGYDPGSWVVGLGVAVGIWLTYLIVTRGVHILNVSNAFIGPGLGILSIVMLGMLFYKHGWGEIIAAPPLNPLGDPWLNYMIVFEWGVASGISWWGGIGFLSRNTNTRRNAVYPELLQLGFSMSLVCCVSLFSGLVVRTDDPTEWMIPIGGIAMGLLALLFVGFANVSSAAVSIYTTGLAMRHLRSLRTKPWWHIVIWSLVPCVPFVFWPTELYSMGDAYLAYNGTMFAPIAGILFADLFFVRRQRLNVWAIFENHPSGEYYYSHGFNWGAFVSLLAGMGLYFYLFNPSSREAHTLFRFLSATLPSCLASCLVYWAWMSLLPRRKAEAIRPAGTEPVPKMRRLIQPNI